jgi:hypothetical protein
LAEQRKPDFWARWRRPAVLRRAARVALVVGTLLLVINHWEILAGGALPALWKVALTYLVPFAVSTYSSARHAMEQDG